MTRAHIELNAMQAIADALASVPDGDSRQRVLRWAAEHFGTELVPTVLVPSAPVAASQAQSDATCDPENLDSLFNDAAPAGLAVRPAERPDKSSVVSSLHSFVADFQKLASDWQKA